MDYFKINKWNSAMIGWVSPGDIYAHEGVVYKAKTTLSGTIPVPGTDATAWEVITPACVGCENLCGMTDTANNVFQYCPYQEHFAAVNTLGMFEPVMCQKWCPAFRL